MSFLVYLSMLLMMGVGIVSYSATHALFSDAAQSTDNVFSASAEFPTPTPTITPTPTETPTPTPTVTPTPIPALVINEMSSDGNPNIEWVEIFNPTASSIDVSGWKITDALTDDIFPSVSPIPSGGYAVIIGNASTVSVPSSAITITLGNSTIGSGLNDAGDIVRLKTPLDVIVDEMSYGDNTTIFTLTAPDNGESLSRSPNGTDTNIAADWQIDTSPTLGTVNSL